jgi:hypothetical protein
VGGPASYVASLQQVATAKLREEALGLREGDAQLAESMGLVRARRKYSPDNLEWFVLYQFAGISSKTIADRYVAVEGKDLDESTVLKGIKAAAKLIGWNHLRQSRQNRKTR